MREQGLGKEFSRFGVEEFGKLPSMQKNYAGLSADFAEIQKWKAEEERNHVETQDPCHRRRREDR